MNARINPTIFATCDLCFTTISSGICIPYVACGSGEPVIFIHGSLCDYRYWNSQVSYLSGYFFCISISLSHYWPVDDASIQEEFSWRTHVKELAEFITATSLGPVHLVGHSRGGCVAFHLAREHPHLVATLTLVDPGGPLQIGGSPEVSMPPAVVDLRNKVASFIARGAIVSGLELFVDSVSMPGIWRKSPVSFRTMAIDNATTLPKQFLDQLPAYSSEKACGVRCKTLLIEGEKSPSMYRRNIEHLAAWLPLTDRKTIAGASHGMNVTHAGIFNRLLKAFLGG